MQMDGWQMLYYLLFHDLNYEHCVSLSLTFYVVFDKKEKKTKPWLDICINHGTSDNSTLESLK